MEEIEVESMKSLMIVISYDSRIKMIVKVVMMMTQKFRAIVPVALQRLITSLT